MKLKLVKRRMAGMLISQALRNPRLAIAVPPLLPVSPAQPLPKPESSLVSFCLLFVEWLCKLFSSPRLLLSRNIFYGK